MKLEQILVELENIVREQGYDFDQLLNELTEMYISKYELYNLGYDINE
jgi:hypothetical protein